MPSRKYPSDIFDQADDILAACKQIDATMTAGNASQQTLAEEMAQAKDLQSQLNLLEKQMIDLRIKRDAHLNTAWDTIKRLRALVKSTYGDDSAEYELIGGTRLSTRKRPTRKTTV